MKRVVVFGMLRYILHFRQQSFSTRIRRRKRRATRVLGLIFLVFVVLWTPFFVLNLLSALCPTCVEVRYIIFSHLSCIISGIVVAGGSGRGHFLPNFCALGKYSLCWKIFVHNAKNDAKNRRFEGICVAPEVTCSVV